MEASWSSLGPTALMSCPSSSLASPGWPSGPRHQSTHLAFEARTRSSHARLDSCTSIRRLVSVSSSAPRPSIPMTSMARTEKRICWLSFASRSSRYPHSSISLKQCPEELLFRSSGRWLGSIRCFCSHISNHQDASMNVYSC